MEYTFYWRDGKKQNLRGNTPAQALTQAGYNAEDVVALDFFFEENNNEYVWNTDKKEWEQVNRS